MKLPLTPHGRNEMTATTLVLGAAGLALLATGAPALAAIPLALELFILSFFRDPERTTPPGTGDLVSPADGTVDDITELREETHLQADALRIGIFLSVFNCHVNRAPCAARVAWTRHTPGIFLNAMDPRSSAENEANAIALEMAGRPVGDDRVLVRQVAGLIATRIVCPLAAGETLAKGQRVGMIKFGSRTELIVPRSWGTRVLVKKGDTVKGGLTRLLEFPGT
ncbi:MAG: phosphatidylserine decarboxylase family protein [Planctomycetes bacterium]|nr:phosphatidylserine decarboxylase family protein [Planctomycetota bacterium]